jgi:hypothetical protein
LKIRELCQVPMQVQDLQHLQCENGWRNATGEKILREIRVLQVHKIWVPNVDGMGPEKEFPLVETSNKEATLPSCSGKDPLS